MESRKVKRLMYGLMHYYLSTSYIMLYVISIYSSILFIYDISNPRCCPLNTHHHDKLVRAVRT